MQPADPGESAPQVAFYVPDGQLLQVLDGAAGSGREATAVAGGCSGEAVVVGAAGCLRAYALGSSGGWEAGPPCPVRCPPWRDHAIAGAQLAGRQVASAPCYGGHGYTRALKVDQHAQQGIARSAPPQCHAHAEESFADS